MAKQSSVNLDITNNPDGFDISGGTTLRKLSVTGGNVTIAGSGSATVTFPTTSTTIAGLGIAQSFTALQTFSAGISAAGGVTFAGTLQGTTASFTGLVSSAVGFSGAGTNLTNVAKLNTSNTFSAGSSLNLNGVGMFASQAQFTSNSIIFTEGYDGGSTTLLGQPNTGLANTVTLPRTTGTVALTNTTVASVNGFTGAVQVTGSGAIVHSVSGTTTTLGARLASISVTGVASFNNVHFTVDATGHVKLASAYQVTGQTIVAGNNISTTTSGNTVTINVTAAGANTYVQFNSNGSLSADNGLQFDSSTETLRIGSAARHIQISPGAEIFVQAFGASNLRLVQTSGNPITIGDYDGNYGGNNTHIEVDDVTSRIYMNASTTQIDSTVSVNFGLSASSLYVSSGATFSGNFSGATGSFSKLLSASAGISAAGSTFSGNVNLQDNTLSRIELLDYCERFVDLGDFTSKAAQIPIDLSTGQVFRTKLTVACTGLSVTNTPDNGNANAVGFTLLFVGDGSGRSMTWNIGSTAAAWAGGIAPTYTSTSNKIDVYSFLSRDGGSTWLGFVGGQNF
jgi:hypothetical protein